MGLGGGHFDPSELLPPSPAPGPVVPVAQQQPQPDAGEPPAEDDRPEAWAPVPVPAAFWKGAATGFLLSALMWAVLLVVLALGATFLGPDPQPDPQLAPGPDAEVLA